MADASAVAGAAKSLASALHRENLYGLAPKAREVQRGLDEFMQQFLQGVDANPYLLKQYGQLRILIYDVQELAFQTEDAIDTYLIDVRSKISLVSHCHSLHILRKKIKAIQEKLRVAINRSEEYKPIISATGKLQGAGVGSSYSKPVIFPDNRHLDDEFVVGIGDDIARLTNLLTEPRNDIQVLGIVGSGGEGKTTLASQIYRHHKVQSSFPYRAFVSISQQWSRLDLLRRISKEILGRSDEIFSSENELIKELCDFMKDKQCFLVLDDFWTKEAWDDIYHILSHTQGLRVIIVTTTMEILPHADKKCTLHQPRMLNKDQMWELFSKGALKGRHGIENSIAFEKLGKQMLQKCYGMPLAVVTLVGLLRTKKYLYEWERASAALSGGMFERRGGSSYSVVKEMLELSYLELPAHLKPLFLYLAIMPENKMWTPNQLIEMWIAEGFVTSDKISTSETLEDKGMQFISELAQRNIIQVKKRNHRDEVEFVYLHDFVRKFCFEKAWEYQFLEHISSTCSYEERITKARRVSIFSREPCPEEKKYVRTIVYQGLSHKSDDEVLRELDSIHKDFKLLRVLRISDCANKTLPLQIGNLIHLTYLSVTRTQITELPESVKKLCNLIYLEFNPVLIGGRTAKVPDDLVGSMENLRVLELPDRLLKGGSRHCNILGINGERHKKLHKFICGAGKWMTKDLYAMHLLTLRDLQITKIEEIKEMEAIHQCLGFLKGSLQTFRCEFHSFRTELKFDTEKLMGSQSLHTLYLHGLLISNLTIQFPANLVSIGLSGSEIGEGVDLMGILGQLSKLKDLCIACQAYLGSQIRCRGTSFPQLEELTLRSLDSLKEWIVEEGAMDRLKKITLVDCLSLKRLPQGIKSITTLKELEITSMPEEFCWRLGFKGDGDEDGGPASSVQTQRGEDSYIIKHIPSVKLDYIIHTSTGVSGGDTLSNQTEYPIAHIPEVSIDEKVIQSLNDPTMQVQTGNAHDPETESCFDSNVDDIITEYELSGGDSLSNKTEPQSPISPDEVTQLTPPTPTEIVPVWNEYQHTSRPAPAAEHHGPALRVGFENQDGEEGGTDLSTRGGPTREASIAALDLLVHPEIHASRGTDDNNNDINKEEAKGMLFLFGEGYEFEKLMLIQLWMALGLLADEPMEENGAFYFENLVSEGYILCSVPNYLYRVNFEKLGTEVNSEKQSCIKLDSATQNSDSSAETLHASVGWDEINASVFQALRGFRRLRTLLFLGSYSSRLQQVPRDLFLCFESLEALDLSGTHIKNLPISAGKMINLRYLDLSWSFIEVLPERIDRFKKLQTLKLEGCSRLRKLPNETKELTDLRHLYLDVLRDLAAFPRGMGALLNIRTLYGFPIGTEQGLEISELKYLNNITGSFCIANIENVQSADVAKEAFLYEKKKIKKLKLKWSNHKTEYPTNEAEGILQNLCPFLNLEEIEIVQYPGIKLPDWIADVSFDKLANITLFGCAKLNMLPSMENLPALASLELISLNSLTKMDFNDVADDYVAFPKLKKLSVDEMLNLETWAEAGEGDYPCIEELSIKDCPKLSEFPSVVYVPSLKHLEVSGCESVVLESDKTLPEFLEQLIIEECPLMEDRCSKDGGQDWYKIQHVPSIWVNHVECAASEIK